jgi:hypothetical protein
VKKKALCHMSTLHVQACERKAGENNLSDGINMIEPMRCTGPWLSQGSS